jgi:hypothetical protein
MREKWVDTHGYFGPDRRRRTGKKPWKDRRTLDEAGQLPSLGHLLRRLRVQAMDLSTPDDRRHMLQIMTAAITEAERNQAFRCADALKQADRLLRLSGNADMRALDELLSGAMNDGAAGR